MDMLISELVICDRTKPIVADASFESTRFMADDGWTLQCTKFKVTF